MICRKLNILTVLGFSICGLQVNQAAVAPVSLFVGKQAKNKVIVKNEIKKQINFNSKFRLQNNSFNTNLWSSKQELNLKFIGAVNSHLKKQRFSYNFNKHLPKNKDNLSSGKIFEKISLGYMREAFALEKIKDSVEKVQPSFSAKGDDSSLNFKLDTLQTCAKAIYKSNFEAKLILDFNIHDSEFVLSKNLTKNTAITFNLKNSDIEQRQTVNLALAW